MYSEKAEKTWKPIIENNMNTKGNSQKEMSLRMSFLNHKANRLLSHIDIENDRDILSQFVKIERMDRFKITGYYPESWR